MLSQKQRIYIAILDHVLPYVRNVETWSFWRRARHGDALREAELVHNLPRCLQDPDFGKEDIWWLNVQAKSYCQQGSGRPCHPVVARAVRQLFDLVPTEMKSQLEWEGP